MCFYTHFYQKNMYNAKENKLYFRALLCYTLTKNETKSRQNIKGECHCSALYQHD